MSSKDAIVQTWHFSTMQILTLDVKNDSEPCLNCPFSYSNNGGKSGGCYTHKYPFSAGLKSKMKHINGLFSAGKIQEYSPEIYQQVYNMINDKKLFVRLGAYGEAVLMPKDLIHLLHTNAKKRAGYTHTWQSQKYPWANNYFMASTHGQSQVNEAEKLGYRCFNVGEPVKNSVQCPSGPQIAKEKRVPCDRCGLCAGTAVKAKHVNNPLH